MSDPARSPRDQDGQICSNSGYPQWTDAHISQMMSLAPPARMLIGYMLQYQTSFYQHTGEVGLLLIDQGHMTTHEDRCLHGSDERCNHSILGHVARLQRAFRRDLTKP